MEVGEHGCECFERLQSPMGVLRGKAELTDALPLPPQRCRWWFRDLVHSMVSKTSFTGLFVL